MILAVAVATVLATPRETRSAGLPAQVGVGFNDTLLSVHPQFPISTFVERLSAAGAELHRMSLSWQFHESTRGQPDYGYFGRWDDLYRQEAAIGVRQVIQLVGTPPWALDPDARKPNGGVPCTDPGANCLAPPNVRDPAVREEWKQWVRTVVTRYPTAAAIEVWNEPNLEWAWIIKQDTDLYGELVAATHEAVESVDPAMPVLAGSIAGVRDGSTPSATHMSTFIDSMFTNSATGHFDAISFHSYPCGFGPPADRVRNDTNRIRAIKNYRGVPEFPLWLTETGAGTSGPTPANCADAFMEAEQGPALGAVIDWARSEAEAVGDLRVLLINHLYNERARVNSLDTPNANGKYEYGIEAWRWNSSGQIAQREKPGFATVACKFKKTC